MRKRYRILLLAAVIAALAVPLGFALSFEAAPAAPPAREARLAAPMAMTIADPSLVSAPGGATILHSMPDAAKLLGIGTVLFGLAAAVRKAA